MTFAASDWECDLEGDDTCACSTSTECKCAAEPVCSGPLVGTLIDLEVECALCGAPMSTKTVQGTAKEPT